MTTKVKKIIAWSLFIFQVVMAWVYTIPQVQSIRAGRTEGLNLAFYTILMLFILFSLVLSIASFKQEKKIDRLMTVIIFSQWVICVGLMFISGIEYIRWEAGDTWVSVIVLILSAITLSWFKGVREPYSKAAIALWCKSVPQVWLTYTIVIAQSGDGIPFTTLIAAHLTSIPRLAAIVLSGFNDGWDKPTKGLIVSEIGNITTWTAVTIAWFYFKAL